MIIIYNYIWIVWVKYLFSIEMAVSSFNVHSLSFDRSLISTEAELSELKKSKTGVKEVVDAGITKVPDIFIYPKQHQQKEPTATTNDGHQEVPVIDLQGLQGERRSEIVSQIRRASETWGIFQLINHGVPQEIILSMLESMKEFNEQPQELKSEYYYTGSYGASNKVQFHLSINPLLKVGLWKDSFFCHFEDMSNEEIEALPYICRKGLSDYVKSATELKDILSELLSEALGLRSDYLKTISCLEATKVASHYYPACPEPSLVMGTSKHSDAQFLTFLVQNQIDALQVLYKNQWINVNVKKGAILANIGDLLQLISNDIFKSVEHRVIARSVGPRVSCACFFHPSEKNMDQPYGPIKELLESEKAPAFRETSQSNYFQHFLQSGITGQKGLSGFRI